MAFGVRLAESVVFVFSFIAQAVGLPVVSLGMASVYFHYGRSMLFQLFSLDLAWIFLCVGLALLVVSLLGYSGAGLHVGPRSCFCRPCCLFRCSRMRSLLLATLFTCLTGAVLVGCFAAVRAYEDEAPARTNTSRNSAQPDGQDARAETVAAGRTLSSFGKQVVKGAFVHAYSACRPTVYNSTMLNSARYCGGSNRSVTTITTTVTSTSNSTATATADVDIDYGKYCGRPSQVPDDRMYMYCTANRLPSLVYPAGTGSALEDAWMTKDFGVWISSHCLPQPADVAAAFAATFAAAAVHGASSDPFSACYNSEWWPADEREAGPAVFDGLPEGELFSAKAAYCFCSESAQGSELWLLIGEYADYFKWALLGLCILVAFALIAEIYLVCGCKRDKQDEPWRLTPSVAPRLVSTNSRTVLARSLSV